MTLGDEARGRGGGEESAHLSEIKGINKRSDRERTGGRGGHGKRNKAKKTTAANACLGCMRPFPGLVSA